VPIIPAPKSSMAPRSRLGCVRPARTAGAWGRSCEPDGYEQGKQHGRRAQRAESAGGGPAAFPRLRYAIGQRHHRGRPGNRGEQSHLAATPLAFDKRAAAEQDGQADGDAMKNTHRQLSIPVSTPPSSTPAVMPNADMAP
jgi:hypothetical protein